MPTGKKYGGRTQGTPNKKTAVALSRAENILRIIERDYFQKDLKALTPAQRMVLYSDMLEYVSPKLSRQDLNVKVNKIQLEIVRKNSAKS